MNVDAVSLEELGLLECLHAISHGGELTQYATALRQRLIETGLAAQGDDGLSLTPAGIERCRSLQHRVASDREAQRALNGHQTARGNHAPSIIVATSVAAELGQGATTAIDT
jgi:hypothetical protein